MMIRRNAVMALCRKEIRSWFYSPLFYGTVLFMQLFLSLWLYYFRAFFVMDSASFRAFFSAFPYAYILVVPVITMKSWAEEKKTGTAELLFTMPLSEWELCLGKFASSFTVLVILLLISLSIPLSLLPLARFDIGVIVTEYAGAFLLGAAALSIGLYLSNLSKNQAAAFLSCAAVLLILMFMNQFTLASGFYFSFLHFISLSYHFESFARGLLDSRDIAFFLLSTLLFLFLNTRLLVSRKWS